MPRVCETATQPPTTPRCAHRHLVGHGRGERGEHRVERRLGEAPAEHHRQHRRRAVDEQHAARPRRATRAADHPRHAGGRSASVVRSDSAPNSGLATTDTARPDAGHERRTRTPCGRARPPRPAGRAAPGSARRTRPTRPRPASVTPGDPAPATGDRRLGQRSAGGPAADGDRCVIARLRGDHVAVPGERVLAACAAACRSRRAPGRSAWCTPRPTRSCRAATR